MMMGAEATDKYLDQARLLAQKSALSRRRARAAYAQSASNFQKKLVWCLATIALVSLAVPVFRKVEGVNFEARSRPLLLDEPTRASRLDRFAIDYRLRGGDTIWGLSKSFYGSPSLSNQDRLRRANPGLPDDPRQLRIDVAIKIPVR